MGRPFDKHIDERELNALVPSCAGEGQGASGPPPASIRQAKRHLASCKECQKKVTQYRQLLNPPSNVHTSEATAPQSDCPGDVEWDEVVAGLWPELRAQQLINHAARCAYCGPRLRAAVSGDSDPTPQEEAFLAQLRSPSRPVPQATTERFLANRPVSIWQRLLDWKVLVPAVALLVLVSVVIPGRPSSPISGMELAQFAASAHEQHLQGKLGLEVRSDSQSFVNEWLHEKSPFSLALPASSGSPDEELPYRVEGARLIQIHSKSAAYIAYQMQADPVSLIVTPISAAVASGGIELDFKKVSFHYYMIRGHKVVTWSVHGLTYALVSQEGNKTQRSCMVCHSAMRDRDLSRTPTPLPDQTTVARPVWQSQEALPRTFK